VIIVVVTGSRNLRIYETIYKVFDRINDTFQGEEVILINGGATGVDRDARIAAAAHDWYVETYEPDWRPGGVYDKAAGHKRNRLMIEEAINRDADHVYGIGFMDPLHPTPGTAGCIIFMKARRPKLKLAVYDPHGRRWM
jgi:hypothetical protein